MAYRAQTTCILAAMVSEMDRAWCVVEYQVLDPTNAAPPLPIYIVATKLTDAHAFGEANRNSEWRKIVTPGHALSTIVHGIGDKDDCIREATRMIHNRVPRPRCNLYGHNNFQLINRLTCSNGKTYQTQAEAAADLNLSQSHISQHLRGKLRHVKGYTFTRSDETTS